MNDKVRTVDVEPEQLGWRRHETQPRTWYTKERQLYVFPPRQPERLVVLRDGPRKNAD